MPYLGPIPAPSPLDPETTAFLARWDRAGGDPQVYLSSSVQAQETTPPALKPIGTLDRSCGHPLEVQSRFQRAAHSPFNQERWHIVNSLWQPEASDLIAKRALRMGQCCQMPSIRLSSDKGIHASLSRCRDRMCPLCAERRGTQAMIRTAAVVAKFNSPRFITLTLKHRKEGLSAMLDRLQSSIQELRKAPKWQASVLGGIFGFEVTRNVPREEWHAHVHIIVDGHYLAHSVLKAHWTNVTGDSTIVDIRTVPDRRKAARYISRYVAKPVDSSSWKPADIREYAEAMHGKRLLQTFGNAHNVKLDEDLYDEKPASSRHLCTALGLQRAVDSGVEGAERATKLLARMGRDHAVLAGEPWVHGTQIVVPDEAETAWLVDLLTQIGDPFPPSGGSSVVGGRIPDGYSLPPPDPDLPWPI